MGCKAGSSVSKLKLLNHPLLEGDAARIRNGRHNRKSEE